MEREGEEEAGKREGKARAGGMVLEEAEQEAGGQFRKQQHLRVLAQHDTLGEGPWGAVGSGSADLSIFLPLSAHCLPVAFWLDLLTSACCRLAAPSLPAAPPAGCTEARRWGLQPLLSWGERGRRAVGRMGPHTGGPQETGGGQVRPAQRPGPQGLASWSRREEGAGLARSAKALKAAGCWILWEMTGSEVSVSFFL